MTLFNTDDPALKLAPAHQVVLGLIDGYTAELLAAPPVAMCQEERGARACARKDVPRAVRAVQRAYGLDLPALIAAAVAWRDADNALGDPLTREAAEAEYLTLNDLLRIINPCEARTGATP